MIEVRSATVGKNTPDNVKQLLPHRQIRGIARQIMSTAI